MVAATSSVTSQMRLYQNGDITEVVFIVALPWKTLVLIIAYLGVACNEKVTASA